MLNWNVVMIPQHFTISPHKKVLVATGFGSNMLMKQEKKKINKLCFSKASMFRLNFVAEKISTRSHAPY